MMRWVRMLCASKISTSMRSSWVAMMSHNFWRHSKMRDLLLNNRSSRWHSARSMEYMYRFKSFLSSVVYQLKSDRWYLKLHSDINWVRFSELRSQQRCVYSVKCMSGFHSSIFLIFQRDFSYLSNRPKESRPELSLKRWRVKASRTLKITFVYVLIAGAFISVTKNL